MLLPSHRHARYDKEILGGCAAWLLLHQHITKLRILAIQIFSFAFLLVAGSGNTAVFRLAADPVPPCSAFRYGMMVRWVRLCCAAGTPSGLPRWHNTLQQAGLLVP